MRFILIYVERSLVDWFRIYNYGKYFELLVTLKNYWHFQHYYVNFSSQKYSIMEPKYSVII